jgi:hypothetical protein
MISTASVPTWSTSYNMAIVISSFLVGPNFHPEIEAERNDDPLHEDPLT